MSQWSYSILPSQNLILTAFKGKITIADITQSNVSFSQDEAFNEKYDLLVDLSRCISIGFRVDILDYISFFKKRFKLKTKVRVCIIVETLNQEYLARFYKTFGESLNLDIAYFRDINEGIAWMKKNEAQKSEILTQLEQMLPTE